MKRQRLSWLWTFTLVLTTTQACILEEGGGTQGPEWLDDAGPDLDGARAQADAGSDPSDAGEWMPPSRGGSDRRAAKREGPVPLGAGPVLPEAPARSDRSAASSTAAAPDRRLPSDAELDEEDDPADRSDRADDSSHGIGAPVPGRLLRVMADPASSASYRPGTLPGDLEVTDDGMATYSLPLEVPLGTAGLTPQVSLEYRSTRRSGALGVGWTLGASSLIARCPRIAADDGWARPLQGNSSDMFCLDGKRLIAVQGTYGQDGTQYRTEFETFTRVISRGGDAKGPTTFEVRTPDRRMLTYGAAATRSDGGVRNVWALAEVRDRNGNTITYSYSLRSCDPDTEECFATAPTLTRIVYGSRDGSEAEGDQSADREVTFTYSTGVRADRGSSYGRGVLEALEQRLERIDTKVNGAIAATYVLKYDEDSGASHLRSVARCSGLPNGTCLRPTVFSYSRPTLPGAAKVLSYAENVIQKSSDILIGVRTPQYYFVQANPSGTVSDFLLGRAVVLDVNGDGREDILTPSYSSQSSTQSPSAGDTTQEIRTSVSYYLLLGQSSGDAFSAAKPAGINAQRRDRLDGASGYLVSPMPCFSQQSVIDYNRDGRDDLLSLCPMVSGWSVYISDGSTFIRQEIPALPDGYGHDSVVMLDLTGDGWDDLLLCHDGTLELAESQRKVAAFAKLRSLPRLAKSRCDKSPSLFLDTDGDGVVNIVRPEPSEDGPSAFSALQLSSSQAAWKGLGLSLSVSPFADPDYRPLDSARRLVDVYRIKELDHNGDGLSDLVSFSAKSQRLRLRINTSKGFRTLDAAPKPSWSWYQPDALAFSRSRVVDWNGDGRSDLLMPIETESGVRWVLHEAVDNPGTFVAKTVGDDEWKLGDEAMALLADHDGDGERDLILAPKSGRLRVVPTSSGHGHLLTRISNGLGKQFEITYSGAPGAPLSVYKTTQKCPTHLRCLRRRPYLVAKFSTSQLLSALGDAPAEAKLLRRTELSYEDGHVGGWGRGWLGFARVVRRDYEAGNTLVRTETSVFDNTTLQTSFTGTSAKNWYPFARLAQSTRTVYGGTTRSQLNTHKHAVKLSTDKRPFSHRTGTTSDELDTPSGGSERLLSRSLHTVELDGYGNPTRVVHETQNSQKQKVASHEVRTTFVLSDDNRGRWLIRQPQARSETSTLFTDASHSSSVTRSFSFTHDTRGRLLTTTREPSSKLAAEWLKTTLAYDRYGNLTSLTKQDLSGRSRRETFAYDARGLLPIRKVDALGASHAYSFERVYGQLLTDTDPNQVRVLSRSYDVFGRLVDERTPGSHATLSYFYPQRDQLDSSVARQTQLVVTRAVEGGETTSTLFDSLGRSIQSTVTGYFGQRVSQETRYDYADRPTYASSPHQAGKSPSGYTERDYDSLGRVLRERRADDAASNQIARVDYAYSTDALASATPSDPYLSFHYSQRVRQTDPKGRASWLVLGTAGEILAAQDTAQAWTRYRYAPFGNLAGTTDAAGHSTSMTYDVLGRQTRRLDPGRGTETFVYDAFDQVAERVNGAGQRTRNDYDSLGRLTRRTEADGSAATFAYDGTGPGQQGQLVEARTLDSAGTTVSTIAYEYDAKTLQVARVRRVYQDTFDTTMTYDSLGRLARVGYPTAMNQGLEVSYGYDTFGHLISVKNATSGTSYWTLSSADQGFRPQTEKLGNGLETTWSYQSKSGRVQSMTTRSAGSLVAGMSFTYDAVGNVVDKADALSSARSRHFSYDGLDRLIKVERGTEELQRMAYDAIGNITFKSDVGSYQYSETRPHAVTTAGTSIYSYDDAGNQRERSGPLVEGAHQEIVYSSFNLPVTATVGQGNAKRTTTFIYDAFHSRLAEHSDDGAASTYVGDLYERSVTEGRIRHVYRVWNGERAVAEITREQASSGAPLAPESVRYVHVDHLGTPDAITDLRGAVVDRPLADAFGDMKSAQVTVGFTGHRTDQALGVTNMKGRLYDPKLGRFLSPDPFVSAPFNGQALNRYAYVLNNPLNYTDPSGFVPVCLAGGICSTEGDPIRDNSGDELPWDTVVVSRENVNGVNYVMAGGIDLPAPPPPGPGFGETFARSFAFSTGMGSLTMVGGIAIGIAFTPGVATAIGLMMAAQAVFSLADGGAAAIATSIGHAASGELSTQDAAVLGSVSGALLVGAVSWGAGWGSAGAGTAAEEAALAARGVSPVVQGGGLMVHEAAGGHLLARHVGKSTSDLAARLAAETRIPAASTFLSRAEAEAAMSGLLDANAARISSWAAAGARGRLTFDGAFSGGSVLMRGASSPVAGSGVRAVLQGNGSGGWGVLTGFPLP